MSAPTSQYLSVAVPVPLHKTFLYSVPGQLLSQDHSVSVGMRVEVPFGNRYLIGVVIDVHEQLPAALNVDAKKVRPIRSILDQESLIGSELISFGQWASDYYHHPIGEALIHMLPALLRKGEPAKASTINAWQLTDKGSKVSPEQLEKRSPKQAALLHHMQQAQQVSQRLLTSEGFGASVIKGLVEKDLLEASEMEPLESAVNEAKPGPQLNTEQHQATQAIQNQLGEFKVSLLEGITGSGKTEVYLSIVQACINRGKQVLVLVPEIGLTPQTIERFRQRLQVPISMSHSGLTDRQRLDTWLNCRSGKARVLIGTRSAIFAPLPELGLIIVDEEHDPSFKQQDGYRYHARDLAVKRAANLDIPVLLGSATPSMESIHNTEQGRYQGLTLTQRAGNALPPKIELVDLGEQNQQLGVSEELNRQIKQHLNQGNQVLLFLNRRGFAPTLMCQHCGWLANCHQCDSRLTLHNQPPQLLCHHCGHRQAIPHQCPDCGSHQLQALGQGTARTEDFLQQQFPDFPVIRIDRDSTQKKDSFAQLLTPVHQGKPCLLIGTQMLAKGHHFPNVTLVAILDADAGLFSSDFRAVERMAQLLTQVAGRAGRADKAGTVLIQTWHPQHPVFQSLLLEGYGNYVRQQLLPQRLAANLPPAQAMAMIRADARQRHQAEQFLHAVAQQISDDLTLTGPLPAPLARRAGFFRHWLVLQHPSRGRLQQELTRLCQWIEQSKLVGQISWGIDVDPQDFS